ncbi:hypothetical protein CRE_23369 [Caenorhabditis remanei]|uniref:Uncharacterized protein n=1 Tax=Caenorhabditis remanei TaxID=31234 RepID=E3MH48_CAERE|nr:hypothetical protein CRE_23369 [Caenorhabditis remanei]
MENSTLFLEDHTNASTEGQIDYLPPKLFNYSYCFFSIVLLVFYVRAYRKNKTLDKTLQLFRVTNHFYNYIRIFYLVSIVIFIVYHLIGVHWYIALVFVLFMNYGYIYLIIVFVIITKSLHLILAMVALVSKFWFPTKHWSWWILLAYILVIVEEFTSAIFQVRQHCYIAFNVFLLVFSMPLFLTSQPSHLHKTLHYQLGFTVLSKLIYVSVFYLLMNSDLDGSIYACKMIDAFMTPIFIQISYLWCARHKTNGVGYQTGSS